MLNLSLTQLTGALAFVAAGFIVYVLTPFTATFADRVGVVDAPGDERRIHVTSTPLLGGLVIYLAVTASMVLLAPWGATVKAILVGGSVITVVGLVDDLIDMNPLVKFFGQLAAIGACVAFSVRMDSLSLPFASNSVRLPLAASIVITVLWFAAIINMVNFIDGLDGLAAGICAISAVTFGVIAFSLNRPDTGIVAFVLAGATLSFLRFNFHPASIFMGDAGSMFLGFVLGVLSVQGVMKSTATVALILPLLVLGVPFIDLFLIVFRRVRRRVPFYSPGQDHVHHDLVLVAGFSQRKSVLLLYIWCILLNGTAVAMAFRFLPGTAVLGAASVLLTIFLGRLLRRYRQLGAAAGIEQAAACRTAAPPVGSESEGSGAADRL
jgi:UDP-GlcNAc:undecaprenyl-phosphate/decaprenyl-phosphate GlcNAc-1-phosphate transferase